MWTKIENYLKQNRPALDVEDAPKGLWDKLEKELHPPKPWYKNPRILSIAAMLTVGFGAVIFLLARTGPQTGSNIAMEIPEGAMEFNEWYESHPELREAEFFYQTASTKILGEIDQLLPEEEKAAYAFVNDLEKAYEELKSDAISSGLTRPIIEAMINNYRLRILLLEKLLKELKRADDKSQLANPSNPNS